LQCDKFQIQGKNLADSATIANTKGDLPMKQKILNWTDQEIERLDRKPESRPPEIPEVITQAFKNMVKGITWH